MKLACVLLSPLPSAQTTSSKAHERRRPEPATNATDVATRGNWPAVAIAQQRIGGQHAVVAPELPTSPVVGARA